MSAVPCFNPRFLKLIVSHSFLLALAMGTFSGALCCLLMKLDYETPDLNLLEKYNPEKTVFNVFIVFSSLVAAFRTSHALVRYVDAASLMHKQCSCWYDAISTLVTFTRTSDAPKQDVRRFNELAVRLGSLLSGLCLEGLEHKKANFERGHEFDVIGWDDLHPSLKKGVAEAECKVEYVFQALESLIIDSTKTKVMSIAPPLLSRVFQELGQGMTTYHEAKKFSNVPLPYAYWLITRMILVTEAIFVPFIMATFTKGYVSAAAFTFGGTFLLWFMNGVAETLDNPFKKEANTLEVSEVQDEFNRQMIQLLKNANEPTPLLSDDFFSVTAADLPSKPSRSSVKDVKKTDTNHLDELINKAAVEPEEIAREDSEEVRANSQPTEEHETIEVHDDPSFGAACCFAAGTSPTSPGSSRGDSGGAGGGGGGGGGGRSGIPAGSKKGGAGAGGAARGGSGGGRGGR